MRLVLTANPKRPETERARVRIARIADSMGFSYVFYNGEENWIPGDADAFVVIGGDGSLIRVAHIACRYDIPIIGVHCGRVGFLTELNEDEIETALKRFQQGDYRISYRTMLDLHVNGEKLGTCLNDVLVYKHSFSGVTQLEISIDHDAVGTFFGDGIVIATPTGATGYSLSAGGPVAASGLEAMIITPICPHTLHFRPVVAPISAAVTVHSSEKSFVAADGDRVAELNPGDIVTISKALCKTRILTLGDRNPFRLISEKLR